MAAAATCSHVCSALFKKWGRAFVATRVYMDVQDDAMNVFVDVL